MDSLEHSRGSPISLLKTVSRISNWPFQASRKMQKTPSRSQKKQAVTFHVEMLRLNHIRKGKQRQACTDSQCGFCGCVVSKALKIIVLLLKACLLELYLFYKIWSEAYKKNKLNSPNTTKPTQNGNFTLGDVFSLWDCKRNEVDRFIEQADTFHPTIKFTADVSENEITFLGTVVFKGERFIEKFILDIKTDNRPTETFRYTHFSSCHSGVRRGFIKGEAYKLFKNSIWRVPANFKRRFEPRGYLKKYIERFLSEVTFDSRQSPLLNSKKTKTAETIDFCHYTALPCGNET